MGKKNDTSKEAAAAVAEKKAVKATKASAVKKTAVKKAPAKITKTTFTNDDIALRAYFIAEKRHKAGQPGNSHHDWVEAEKQLLAESKGNKPAKVAKKA